MQIFILKKTQIIIGLIIVLLISVFLGTRYNLSKLVTSGQQKLVVVDAGHGSVDSGAVYDKLEEKTINLQIALILKNLLEERNIKVVMTRSDDSLYNQRRNDDIIYRARKTNEVGADAFISIHVNKFPTAEPFGGQAYYYSGNESKSLAEKIQQELKIIQPTNYRSISTGDFYVLKKTNCPAILVEVGFISNPIDRQRITDPVEQRRIAGAICNGVIGFFREDSSSTSQIILDNFAVACSTKITDLAQGYDIYFIESHPFGEILVPVHQSSPVDQIVSVNKMSNLTFLEHTACEAMNKLIAGPTDQHLTPTIPQGTKLLSLKIINGLAIVDFNKALSTNHWGSAKMEEASIESIVRTLTAFPGIDRVQILIEGQSCQTIAGHIIFDQPLTAEISNQIYNW